MTEETIDQDEALLPFPRFPPYETCAAYVITNDLSRALFETVEYVPQSQHTVVDPCRTVAVIQLDIGQRPSFGRPTGSELDATALDVIFAFF